MEVHKKLSALLVVLLIPNLATCQVTQTMRYKLVNGRLYVEAPSTTPPSLLQTLFPFLSISYTSSNTPEVDEAIINSVSGPPAPPESGGVLSLPSFSSYQSGVNTNQIGSPYLSDDDSYSGSDSVNQYHYVMPPMNAQKVPGYAAPNAIYSSQPAPNPYSNSASSIPYPTGIPFMAPPTTEKSAPFYQPILDFFGWGSSEEEDVANMLPSPSDILNMGSFPSEAIPQIPAYQPAQARHSFVVNPYIMEEESAVDEKETENTESEDESSFTSNEDESKKPEDETKNVTASASSSTSTSSDTKFPCPKLGFWQWDGENCIAIGPSPAWGCKPNDLVMSGRIAVCRNKIFFPQGLKPPGN